PSTISDPPLIKLYDYLDKLVNILKKAPQATFLKGYSLKCLESRSKSIKRPLESRQLFEVVCLMILQKRRRPLI
ncbi:hypothetical protein WDU94_013786, partial [Cyamophila willieti]